MCEENALAVITLLRRRNRGRSASYNTVNGHAAIIDDGFILIADRAAVEVTMEEMLICFKAVRRAVRRGLVSCDLPFRPAQESRAARERAYNGSCCARD